MEGFHVAEAMASGSGDGTTPVGFRGKVPVGSLINEFPGKLKQNVKIV